MRKARRNFAGLAPGRALVTALAVIALLALLSLPSWAVDAPEAPKAAEGKAAKAGAQEPVSPDEAPEATEEAEPPEPPKLPASARSMAHLYELMSREPPMTDSDLASYEKYAGDIVAMAENPELMERIALVSGWTVGRLTYVTVKVGLGLTRLEDPASPALSNVPEFAWPTEEEALLIEFQRDDLAKALRTAQPIVALEPEEGEAAPEAQ